MKTRKLILLFATALMMLAAGCKKEEKPGQLESIRFKQASYTIAENNFDLNLRKELETVPADIINTNKIEWQVSDESIATMSGSFLEPKRDGDVKVTATIQGKSAIGDAVGAAAHHSAQIALALVVQILVDMVVTQNDILIAATVVGHPKGDNATAIVGDLHRQKAIV